MKKIFKVSLFSIIFAIIIFSLNKVNAANLSVNVNFDGEQIKMTSETPDMTWSVDNLLPGESDETIVTIHNIGTGQTEVNFIANVESGEDLADILNIKVIKLAGEVQKNDEEVFKGKYSELTNMSVYLETGKTQAYKIITTLPKETGNEFQNKECKIKLSFVARGIEYVEPDEPVIPDEVEPPKEIITDKIEEIQTGESKTIYIIVGVLVVAMVILVVTFFIGKNKNKEK